MRARRPLVARAVALAAALCRAAAAVAAPGAEDVPGVPRPDTWPVLWADAADSVQMPTAESWPRNPALPVVGDSGVVVWYAHPPSYSAARIEMQAAVQAEREGGFAAAARWWLRAGTGPHGLFRAAPMFLAAGDPGRADSCWAELASRTGMWRWEALRGRAEIALARGEPGRGDSLLGADPRHGWTEAERADGLVLRVRLRLALGDTAQAVDFCRQTLRRYPSLAAAAQAVALLEAARTARGDSLSAGEEREAAEVDYWRSNRASASRRLERAYRLSAGADRGAIALRRAEIVRSLGGFGEALAAWSVACPRAQGEEGRARCLLERARLERDARRPAEALRWYARAAGAALGDSALRQAALWERAREAEEEGRLAEARADYAGAAELGGRRAEDAAFRAGLLWYAEGDATKARRWWERCGGEAARFWLAVSLRSENRAAADSLLAPLARAPGYSFYGVAARETLEVRGWPWGSLGDAWHPHLEGARRPGTDFLLEYGLGDDAADLSARWATRDLRDVRDASPAAAQRPVALLGAAHYAHAAGRTAQGIRLAQRAFDALADSGTARQWAVAPWLYPPAFESLLRERARWARRAAIDLPVLYGLVWQESRFDPRARSRSGALGLAQIKWGTALDVARWSRMPAPAESLLLEPGINTLLGVRYLARLLDRFDGRLPAALAAYNAGPNRVPRRWLELARRGGDALFCELIVYPETQEYVKKILAARGAYRELRPRNGMTNLDHESR